MPDRQLYRAPVAPGAHWVVLAASASEARRIVAGYGDEPSGRVRPVAPSALLTRWAEDWPGPNDLTMTAREWVAWLIEKGEDHVYCPGA